MLGRCNTVHIRLQIRESFISKVLRLHVLEVPVVHLRREAVLGGWEVVSCVLGPIAVIVRRLAAVVSSLVRLVAFAGSVPSLVWMCREGLFSASGSLLRSRVRRWVLLVGVEVLPGLQGFVRVRSPLCFGEPVVIWVEGLLGKTVLLLGCLVVVLRRLVVRDDVHLMRSGVRSCVVSGMYGLLDMSSLCLRGDRWTSLIFQARLVDLQTMSLIATLLQWCVLGNILRCPEVLIIRQTLVWVVIEGHWSLHLRIVCYRVCWTFLIRCVIHSLKRLVKA